MGFWQGFGGGVVKPDAIGARGMEASAGRFLQFLNKKKTHFYAYFGQNSYFKAITHQLKALKISLDVLNRVNDVQV